VLSPQAWGFVATGGNRYPEFCGVVPTGVGVCRTFTARAGLRLRPVVPTGVGVCRLCDRLPFGLQLRRPHMRGGLSKQNGNQCPRRRPHAYGGCPLSVLNMLTLTLSGPFAAYSTAPRLQHRLTGDEPTRTAILGMLRCALGVPRFEPCPDLDGITVTIDQATHAERLRDFQTLRDAVTYDGKPGRNLITTRHYLTEFAATVTLDGPQTTLERIAHALSQPQWQLYLGRRCCVPDAPLLTHSLWKTAEPK
jgi:CRISPR-associated Cas5-like protein